MIETLVVVLVFIWLVYCVVFIGGLILVVPLLLIALIGKSLRIITASLPPGS